MLKHTILSTLVSPGVIVIMRADQSQGMVDAAMALYAGGARAVEVSLTTPGGLETIEGIRQRLPEGCVIGAGTVLDEETVRLATLAGAQFMVSPIWKPTLIQACHRYAVPIAAGAYTPTEAFLAYEAGADLIKIFPANDLGPSYMRALRAPLPQLPLVPTGGVTVENCADFFSAGCVAVGIGTSVVNHDLIQAQAWDTMSERVRAFVDAAMLGRDEIIEEGFKDEIERMKE